MTPFCFDHVFRAASPGAVLDAYFDSAHQVEQDRRIDIVERTLVELVEDADVLRRTCRVVPRRQIPLFLRPFLPGRLHYVEMVRWRRRDDEIDIDIRPSILRGRASVQAVYRVVRVAPGAIRRRYEGTVSVDVALVSARIERGIVAEFERSMPIAASCTQDWLDRCDRSVAARA
jgi:hypothetical protein